MSDPVSVSDIDSRFQPEKGFHRARWYGVAGGALAFLGVVIFLTVLVLSQQSQIRAQQAQLATQSRELESSCGFWYLLGTLPPTANPGTSKPGETGVTLIVDSRDAYLGQGCGHLPSPSAALRQWAAYYRLPLDSGHT